MDLDRVAAVIRPRTYPESVDLGFRMLRAWWRPVAAAWLASVPPLLALLAAALPQRPLVALALFWWLKPLLARPVVFVLSRALFGALPGPGETLCAWPAQARPGLVASLTWLRLDPVRSLRTPVVQLEGLRGTAARRRFRVVSRDVRLEATVLTLTCGAFELCIFLGLTLVLLTFFPLPELAEFWTGEGVHLPLGQQWVLVAFYALASALVEPFYAAGGFGLYINRRTHLEAWDIEVVFRRMASRLAAAVLALVLAAGFAAPVLAAIGEEGQEPVADPDRAIQEVLADPVFGTETVRTRWIWTGPEDPPDGSTPAALQALGAALAAATRTLAWVIAAGGLVWGTFELIRRGRLPRLRSSKAAEDPVPAELLGLDVRADSLPADVPARARELWDAGERRAALQLLYRGALSRLVSRDGLALRPSATEGDCVRIAGRVLPGERLEYFRSLTEAWLVTAYGHRDPDDARAAVLIGGWSAHFGGAA
jgi:hypothetical protein